MDAYSLKISTNSIWLFRIKLLFVLLSLSSFLTFANDCAAQAILNRNSLNQQKAGPNASPPVGNRNTAASGQGNIQTNSGAGQFQSNTSPAAFANPAAPSAGATTDPTLPRVARLLNPPSSLPNQAGQVWRTYDLSPYTRRITSVKNPEQAVVDWVIRETGTDIWFRGPTGVLTAASDRMHVYHTPEVHRKVAGIIDRMVQSQGKNVTLGIRLFTVGKPAINTVGVFGQNLSRLFKPIQRIGLFGPKGFGMIDRLTIFGLVAHDRIAHCGNPLLIVYEYCFRNRYSRHLVSDENTNSGHNHTLDLSLETETTAEPPPRKGKTPAAEGLLTRGAFKRKLSLRGLASDQR